jgi:hypothetical protein
VVVGTQVLDEVILSGEAIATLARAVLDRAVTENRVVDARLVALQVREASERFTAVVATKGLSGSRFGC